MWMGYWNGLKPYLVRVEGRQIVVAGNMPGADARVVWPFQPSSDVGAPSAGVGEAASLGPLSVPPAWTMIASVVESTPPAVPAFGIHAAAPPVAPATLPGRTFQRALMATMTGRDASPQR
jgi:PPE-SVP subfamily C-terminal region